MLRTFWKQTAAITRRNGQSFYVASFILGAATRRRAYLVYSICRLVDDATDECLNSQTGSALSERLLDVLFDPKPEAETLQNEVAQDLLPVLRHTLGEWTPPLQKEDSTRFINQAWSALQECGISKDDFCALVSGQRDDESFSRPQNFPEFYQYCFKVAGVVGLMMAQVFAARRTAKIFQSAEHLGIAMQITNILRDVREDASEKNRVYLPLDLCTKHNFDVVQTLRSGATKESENSGLKSAEAALSELARQGVWYYGSALKGVRGIPGWRERLCVKAMTAIYGAILAEVLREPLRVLRHRVVISRSRKISLFLQVLLGRNPLLVAGLAPHRQGPAHFHEREGFFHK